MGDIWISGELRRANSSHPLFFALGPAGRTVVEAVRKDVQV